MTPRQSRLRELIVARSLKLGAVVLSSGHQSTYYFDCKMTTLDPEGASLIADEFLEIIGRLPEWPDAIGGLTIGADPIVGAIMIRALERGQRLPSFYVRKDPKEHGTKALVENPPPEGSKVVIVEDVVTKGNSVIKAIEQAENIGCRIVQVICLLDRLEGGKDAILSRCENYHTLYTIADFPEIRQVDSVSVPNGSLQRASSGSR
jgi:orotate phosphoribosyltransferase